MDEFSFIKDCLAPLAGPEGLALLDDAAMMTPRPGYDLVLTKDTMVEGVHFPNGIYGSEVAGKLLRVNLSDLAAKGAKPKGYLLSVAWPNGWSEDEFHIRSQSFAAGLEAVQALYDFKLFGGDTVKTAGPMVITATLIGDVPSGKMVQRSGADIGDDIWVSGTIGDAVLGLKTLSAYDTDLKALTAGQKENFAQAYWSPKPRLSFTGLLQNFATSSVDISDGLMADLGHISTASGVGMVIGADDIPLSGGAAVWEGQSANHERLTELITGGDDYEIAFTASAKHRAAIEREAKALGVRLTRIGQCQLGFAVRLNDKAGSIIPIKQSGYRHF